MQDSEARYAFLLALNDILASLSDESAIRYEAARALGEYLRVGRALYMDVTEDGSVIVTRDYVSGLPSLAGVHALSDFGEVTARTLRAGGRLVVDDVESDPRFDEDARQGFRGVGMAATVGTGLLSKGVLVAGFGVQSPTPRRWTPQEVALVQETAERTRSAVERCRAEAVLRDQEERLRLSLAAVSMGTFVWYPDTDVAESDGRLLALFGIPEDGSITLASALAQHIHPDDAPRYAEAVARSLDPAGEGLLHEEIRSVHPDGTELWVAVTGRAYFDAGRSRAVRLVGAAVDVTERKQGELALAAAAERDAFFLKLSDTLRPIGDDVALAAMAARVLGEHLGLDRALYADVVGEEFTVARPFHRKGVSSYAGRQLLAGLGAGVVEYLRAGRTVAIGDVLAESLLTADERSSLRNADVSALVAVPLGTGDQPDALFIVHQRTPRAWTPAEVLLIEETAERTGAAVERVRTQKALDESELELEADLLDAQMLQDISERLIREGDVEELYGHITDAAMVVTRADCACIQMLDREGSDGSELRLLASRGLDETVQRAWSTVGPGSATVSGAALRAGARVLVGDVETDLQAAAMIDVELYRQAGIRAVQSTPLFSRDGTLVGMLTTHWRRPHTPDQRSLRLFDIVARQAADLIERSNVERALRNSETRYRTAMGATLGIVYERDLVTGRSVRSDGMRELLGIEPEDAGATHAWWEARVHPDDRHVLDDIAARLADPSAGRFECEYRVRHDDGRWVDVLDHAVVVRDEAGQPTKVVGHRTDITARTQAARHRAYLAQLDAALRLARTPEETLETALTGLPAALAVDRCTYGAVDSAADQLVTYFSCGATATPAGSVQRFSELVSPSFLAAAEKGEVVTVADVATDARTKDQAEAFAARDVASFIAAPVLRDGAWYALLSVSARGSRTWSPEEVALVENVSARLVPALERATAEAARADSDRQLRLVTDAVPALIAYCDSTSRYRFANRAYFEWFGYEPSHVVGKTLEEVLGREALESVRPHVERALSGTPATFEHWIPYTQGGPRYVRGSYQPDIADDGTVRGFFALILDLTERMQAREEIRATNARLKAIVDGATDYAILTLDRDGTVASWSVGAEGVLGWTESEMVGGSASIIFTEEDREAGVLAADLAVALEQGRAASERWLVRRDGTRFWASGIVTPLRDETGKATGYLKILRDRTDAKRVEDALAEAKEGLEQRVVERTAELVRYQDRLRALLSRLSRAEQLERQRLAAELHDHLAQVLTGAQLLLAAAEHDSAAEVSAGGEGGMPAKTVGRLRELVRESLRYTRSLMDDLSPPPALQQDDLAAALRWVATGAERQGMRVRLTAPREPVRLGRDAITVVYQSVRELLHNVLKYAGTDRATVAISHRDDVVRVVVEDLGRGFDLTGMRPEPDETGGFGLFHIAERVDLMGGRFQLVSAPGKGTRAVIEVPAADAGTALVAAQPTLPAATPARRDGHPIRVLLADDHRVLRDGLLSVLSAQPDITVIGEASDGLEAVEVATALKPDVVVMDVNMPRLDGIEAARRLRDAVPEVRVVGLTMHDEKETGKALRRVGAAGCVNKADAFETLAGAIREAVRRD
jgi:PAS domain S-box-containing protein